MLGGVLRISQDFHFPFFPPVPRNYIIWVDLSLNVLILSSVFSYLVLNYSSEFLGFLGVQWVKNPLISFGWEDLLEEGMVTQSSIIAWRIPWTEQPGGLQFIGSQRVDMTTACRLWRTAQKRGSEELPLAQSQWCDSSGAAAERCLPAPEVRGGGREKLPHSGGQGPCPRGASPPSRSGCCAGGGGPRGATPRSRSGGAAWEDAPPPR